MDEIDNMEKSSHIDGSDNISVCVTWMKFHNMDKVDHAQRQLVLWVQIQEHRFHQLKFSNP